MNRFMKQLFKLIRISESFYEAVDSIDSNQWIVLWSSWLNWFESVNCFMKQLIRVIRISESFYEAVDSMDSNQWIVLWSSWFNWFESLWTCFISMFWKASSSHKDTFIQQQFTVVMCIYTVTFTYSSFVDLVTYRLRSYDLMVYIQ